MVGTLSQCCENSQRVQRSEQEPIYLKRKSLCFPGVATRNFHFIFPLISGKDGPMGGWYPHTLKMCITSIPGLGRISDTWISDTWADNFPGPPHSIPSRVTERRW